LRLETSRTVQSGMLEPGGAAAASRIVPAADMYAAGGPAAADAYVNRGP